MFPPHPTLREAYRSPYGDPYHYYGTQNLLDPNMAYCKHWCLFFKIRHYFVKHFLYFFLNLSHFTVQMDRCLFLVQSLPCLAGIHHQEKLCPVSSVLTSLRVISTEAASQSHRYSKYFPPPFKYLKTILKDIFRKHLSGSKFILLTHSQASH